MATANQADWNTARIRSLGHWQGGALVREYERPARRPDRAPPANDNRSTDRDNREAA